MSIHGWSKMVDLLRQDFRRRCKLLHDKPAWQARTTASLLHSSLVTYHAMVNNERETNLRIAVRLRMYLRDGSGAECDTDTVSSGG